MTCGSRPGARLARWTLVTFERDWRGARAMRKPPASETGAVDARDMRKPPASETGAVDARDIRKPPASETGSVDARDMRKPPASETGAVDARDMRKPPASETGAVDARDRRQPPASETSIEAWPLDACVVHSENASQNVLLSLKAACSLADIHSWLAARVNVVVTLCGREMIIRGAPQDWRQHFEDLGACHLQGHLENWTTRQLRRCALDCFTHWKHLCCQLWRLAKVQVCEKKDMQVLFHCFRGINRSAGALCAWLIVAYGFSAAGTIDLLLEKRPGLRPWRHRRYVLWALDAVEQSRTSWRSEFGDCKADLGERALCDSSGQHN